MSRQQLMCLLVSVMLPVGSQAGIGGEPPPPLLGEEAVPNFVAKEPRSETDQDRLDAAAFFAHGRVLLRQGDRPGALRRFQRAWRYDPESVSITQQIVPLANSLNRPLEAARYAIPAAESHPQDPQLLTQLGALLVQQNDLPRAVRLFERALKLTPETPPDAATVALHLEMGRLYFILGEHAKAANSFALFRDTLEHPENATITEAQRKQLLRRPEVLYRLIGESFLLADRYDESEEVFVRSHDAAPDKARLASQLARVAAARENWDEARRKLDEYFQAKGSTAGPQPYALLERILLATADDEAAALAELVSTLERLYRKDAGNAALGHTLARKLLDAGQLKQSERIFSQVVTEQPTADAFQGLCEIYRRHADGDKLLDLLGRAIDQTKNLDLLGRQLAEIAADEQLMEKLVQQSSTRLQDATETLGQNQRVAMALLTVAAERFDEAEKFYVAALEAEGPAKTQIMETMAFEFQLAGQGDRAVRVYRTAITQDPPTEKAAEYYYYMAGSLESVGKTDEAIKAARRAAALRTDSAQFQNRLPWILYHAERYAQAEQQYRKLLEEFDSKFEPAGVREILRNARLVLSNICVVQDRLAEAEEWLEQILDEFPEDVAVLNDLGYLWADQNKHLLRALDMARRAVDKQPDNAAYLDSLGWAYFRLGRYEDAVLELERAAREEPPDGVILDHLGDAYWETKERDKALATWRKAADALRTQEETKYLEKTEAKIKKHSND